MTNSQMQEYQHQLIRLRDRLAREDAALRDEAMQPTGGEASGGLSNAPVHTADMGTHEYEEEMALRLMDNAERILTEVSAALERMEKGKFGVCEDCHKKIVAKRLQAIPYARYCVVCESQRELAAAR